MIQRDKATMVQTITIILLHERKSFNLIDPEKFETTIVSRQK
ncbi:hypothetical protein [Lysinibacillus sp. NPDC047702]